MSKPRHNRSTLVFLVGSLASAFVGFSIWSVADLAPEDPQAFFHRATGVAFALCVPLAWCIDRLGRRHRGA